MNDLSSILKEVYNTDGVALVPGGGTYGMEAVARQVAVNKHALVIRNGYFHIGGVKFSKAAILQKNNNHRASQIGNEETFLSRCSN